MKHKQRVCKVCPKAISSWNKTGYCSNCHYKRPEVKEYKRKYAKAHPEQREGYPKKYYAENREVLLKKSRDYYHKNRDVILAKLRAKSKMFKKVGNLK